MADSIDEHTVHATISSDRPPGPQQSTFSGSFRWLLIAAGVQLIGLAGLSASVWHGRTPLAVDRRVVQWLDRLPLDGSSRWIRVTADLGSTGPALVMGLALLYWAHRRRDRRFVTIAVVGPVAAVVLGPGIAKPLIGRQLGQSFDFPSGHATVVAALATVFLVLVFTRRGHRAATKATAADRSDRHGSDPDAGDDSAPEASGDRSSVFFLAGASAVAVAAAVSTAVAVVVAGWHVPTDSVAGLLTGSAVVLITTALSLRLVPADRPMIESRGLRALGLLVLAGGAVLAGAIRFPFLVLSPGSLIPLNSAIQVGDDVSAEAGPLHGTYSGLTVRATTLTLSGWAWHELSGSPNPIVAREAVIPPGETGEGYHLEQVQVFASASQVAVAVAEEALGQPVAISGDGALITGVLPGGPADGSLHAGDVVIELDGQTITTEAELRAALDAVARRVGADPPEPAATATTAAADAAAKTVRPVTVEMIVKGPDGELREASVELGRLQSTGRLGLGVGVTTSNLVFDLPTRVTVDGGEVGGPSAGLLTALAVYDSLSPEDLAAGRHITGTGTLSFDGRVGDIGGIEEKARAAVSAGADVFLAPADQAAAASEAVSGARMDVIPVSTFDEALTVLRTA